MKRLILFLALGQFALHLTAQVSNSSYVTQQGEKVLQLSIVVPISLNETWKLFTTEEGLKKWIAPIAKIDMKTGGFIKTNYDANKTIDDPSSIKLDIINYIEYQLLTLKVNLNSNFSQEARNEDKNLQELLQFEKISDKETKITSSMVGWGKGSHWDNAYAFFEKGNTWTFKEILKLF